MVLAQDSVVTKATKNSHLPHYSTDIFQVIVQVYLHISWHNMGFAPENIEHALN